MSTQFLNIVHRVVSKYMEKGRELTSLSPIGGTEL